MGRTREEKMEATGVPQALGPQDNTRAQLHVHDTSSTTRTWNSKSNSQLGTPSLRYVDTYRQKDRTEWDRMGPDGTHRWRIRRPRDSHKPWAPKNQARTSAHARHATHDTDMKLATRFPGWSPQPPTYTWKTNLWLIRRLRVGWVGVGSISRKGKTWREREGQKEIREEKREQSMTGKGMDGVC